MNNPYQGKTLQELNQERAFLTRELGALDGAVRRYPHMKLIRDLWVEQIKLVDSALSGISSPLAIVCNVNDCVFAEKFTPYEAVFACPNTAMNADDVEAIAFNLGMKWQGMTQFDDSYVLVFSRNGGDMNPDAYRLYVTPNFACPF